MAIYHLTVKKITRSKGNTVHKLAYNAATKLRCQRTQQTWDYTDKPVGKIQILLPDDAPQWAKDLKKLFETNKQKGLQILSDLVESAENRNDSTMYRELECALPRELTDEQNHQLAEEFIQDQFSELQRQDSCLLVLEGERVVGDTRGRLISCVSWRPQWESQKRRLRNYVKNLE